MLLLLLSFLLLGVYAGTTSSIMQDDGSDVDALAQRYCWGAKVHEDGTLELDTTRFDLNDLCREFLEVNAHFYQTVLLKGNVVSKVNTACRPESSALLENYA